MSKRQQKHKNQTSDSGSEKVRLDKWLWAARFYKTRGLASEAIKGGKIHVNNHRVKASHCVSLEEEIRIRKDNIETTVVVRQISAKRMGAPIARMMYEETPQSREKREMLSAQKKAIFYSQAAPVKKPNKKQRRHIIKFKEQMHQNNDNESF